MPRVQVQVTPFLLLHLTADVLHRIVLKRRHERTIVEQWGRWLTTPAHRWDRVVLAQ